MADLIRPFGVAGRGRRNNFHSRRVHKMHLRILRVERAAMNASAAGSAQDERSRRAPAIMRLGHHVHDLVKSAADEVHELKFSHRTHAGKRRAKRRAHNGRFGDRRIDDALRAKVMDKTVRDFERAAINANVFTDTEDAGVRLHLFPESLPDCFEISCLSHENPFSADYADKRRLCFFRSPEQSEGTLPAKLPLVARTIRS